MARYRSMSASSTALGGTTPVSFLKKRGTSSSVAAAPKLTRRTVVFIAVRPYSCTSATRSSTFSTGSFGQHPVTQVEYVAAGASRPTKDLPRLRPHVAGRAEKDRGIEVPLDGELSARHFPGFIDGDAPIDAQHVDPRPGHQGQQVACIEAEEDARDGRVERGEESLHMRQSIALVVCGGERADPTVEDLDRLGAVPDLRVQRGGDHIGQLFHEETERI